jgi:hypothetical protein
MRAGEIQRRSTLLAELVEELERVDDGVVRHNHNVGLGRVT